LDFGANSKYKILKNLFFGIYENYSLNISKANYPYGFGLIISKENSIEKSETEFKLGVEKNLEKKFVPSISICGNKKLLKNIYGGFEINSKWDYNSKTNLVFEAKGLMKYLIGKL
jgi:hypothetical protein